jgi:hypothetical protein
MGGFIMVNNTLSTGDWVKVKHQDIYGEIVSIDYDNYFVTIRDGDAETEDDLLDFDIAEVELFKNRVGG